MKRWGTMCHARRRESIVMIWRKRFRFVLFLWDVATSHFKARPHHVAVFQEVRRATTGNSRGGIPEVCTEGIEQLQQVLPDHSVSSDVEKKLLLCPEDMMVFHDFTSVAAH